MEVVLSASITGGLALLGVIFTNLMNNRKIENQLTVQQAVTDQKIEKLTEEVKKHNSFAERVPVLEEQMKVANHRISDLEEKIK